MQRRHLLSPIHIFKSANRHPLLIVFLIVAFLIVWLDILFAEQWVQAEIALINPPIMVFAPQIWLALFSMVLGSLIIAISIASQRTPKLIDLYIRDWRSLFFLWFVGLGLVHNLFVQYISTAHAPRTSSIILNTYVFMPVTAVLAMPYILYTLRSTRPSNVVARLHNANMRQIQQLRHPLVYKAMNNPNIVADYQLDLFETLNQLDNLMEFVSFKEPQANILRKIGQATRTYVSLKAEIHPTFFLLSPTIQDDISFKTMVDQFEQMEASHTFLELKTFRMLDNAYVQLINKGHFDLASLCVFEVAEIGRLAIQYHDHPLTDATLVHLNTILRFGIKHGLRHSEARNLYNAIFHYSHFIDEMVKQRQTNHLRAACTHLKNYSAEIFHHSRSEPAFRFLVDAFVNEMKNLLIALSEADWPLDFQAEMLDLMLQMDHPPDREQEILDPETVISSGVRVLQIGLALYYLRNGREAFAQQIINDLMDDRDCLGADLFHRTVERNCHRLLHFQSEFWEDTDRGNMNMYYTADTDYIPRFLELFQAEINAEYQ
jgi:hypothetical protein